ncbi:TonB-dependent receptor domain-containing protein [Sphingomonas hengshuiensis]|uniref:TonB-dependent receptor n=1 Tax=Sphingomonas hengshuiensis TaxID=1609977 RepID=A0A7U4JA42_9SPHN|nr:TonB-dependent receptor [Sphingomonas hengshuiensis]AJP73050.1 TonB-dependent receptor [Sphingomonas hengshuiensis]
MAGTKSLKTLLVSGTALALLAGALPGVALAQDTTAAAPTDQTQQAEGSEDILVTGSRIVRDGFKSTTPLTVITAEDLQNSAPSNNIADFVNQLPQLAGSTRPSNSRLNLSSGQAGINALNLRNLGEIRTLILIDGRRSVGSTITGLVDINTIPQSLVQRVEASTGGASSAYGSDAVAGVVNFILDKKYEGFKVSADSGITTYGDGGNYSFNAALGKSFAGGRGHILLSGEIAHRDGIFEVDRDWNATGYVRIQDPNWVSGVSTTPRYITTKRQVGAANSTPGGLITASTGTTANALKGKYFGYGGSVNQYQYGSLTYPATGTPSLTQGGDWQVNDSGRRIGLDPQDDRKGVFGRVSFEVTPEIELFAEGSFNKQHILFNAGPNLSTGISLDATGCTQVPVPISCNAYLYNTLGASALTGVTGVTLATTAADLPNRMVDNRRKVQRYVVGAEGQFQAFGNAAHWDVYAQYGRADLREQLRNIMNTAKMNNATKAAFAPAGNANGYAAGSIQCYINVDASTTNDDKSCVALNRLGTGVASSAAIDYVLGDPYRDEVMEQRVAGANLAMTPFGTWAGDVSVALGGEWREEKISGYVPAEFQPVVTQNATGGLSTANTWSVGNYLPTNGKYNVKEAYLETVVPLGFGLEFNGAVRGTDYSTSGYVTTWKLGATWQPIPDIRFRVTRSRDIRAPNLNELYQAGSSNSDSLTNPFGANSGPNGGSYGATISYSGLNQGNPDLRPEKSNSWNIGGVFSPRFLPGFNFSADYFRIDMEDAIDTLSAQSIINRCAEGVQKYCDAITQDPNNSSRILISNQPFNFARKLVRGIDFDSSYRLPTDGIFGGGSSLTLHGVATRYIENISDPGDGSAVYDTVGVNGGQGGTPKWIFRMTTTVDTPTTSVTLVGRGVSAGKYSASGVECVSSCPVTTTSSTIQTYDDNSVSGLFYVDLNLTQKVSLGGKSQAQLFFNVTNVFNRWPLLVPETGLAANSTYSDLLGRSFRAGVRFELR